jgi:hypothetical protein
MSPADRWASPSGSSWASCAPSVQRQGRDFRFNALDGIRRLIQLADERDLRQLPQAAQSIDAVRLMTIHGSKGLEFPVVHVMGLNKGSMPSTAKKPACPVPDGMIAGGQGGTIALAAADHALEQECLFYVAASRARDRSLLYSATQMANGNRRNPSDFIARLGVASARAAIPCSDKEQDPEDAPLSINLGQAIKISTAQLDLYDRCPRRFLYTHVLVAGGRRTPTNMTRMHDIVRQVVRRSQPRNRPRPPTKIWRGCCRNAGQKDLWRVKNIGCTVIWQ